MRKTLAITDRRAFNRLSQKYNNHWARRYLLKALLRIGKVFPGVANSILIVEDNLDVADLVSLHLRDQGYDVDTAPDGRMGLDKALSQSHDLIVLDLMLPGLDGLEICRQIRAKANYVPILMLTAKSTELDRVVGLELGGDDYITKPFSIRELLARIRALFRRVEAMKTAPPEPQEQLVAGPLQIDVPKRRVQLNGKRIELTAREFDLLVHFARHPGRVYSRAELLDLVWGYGHRGYAHTVNTHINRLRTKIEADPSDPRFVLTVWGIGYKFFDPSDGTS